MSKRCVNTWSGGCITISGPAHQELDIFAVVSTSSEKRMQENIETLYIELTEEECEYLDLRRT